MSTYVFTTFRGRRFHDDRHCTALDNGRCVSGSWAAIRARLPREAARAGFTACRVCVPPALALPATGQTHGHEPVHGIGWFGEDETICVRCTERGLYWGSADDLRPVHVTWPCTSAAVLGLVVTDADRWNQRYPVGTPVAAYPWVRADEPLLTRTRTPAWRLGHGDSVVSVDGHAGGIALTHVDPL